MKSNFLSLNISDGLKGLFVAFITALITGIYQVFQNGSAFNWPTLKPVLFTAIAAGLSYIIKNWLSNSQGQVMQTENSPKVKEAKAIAFKAGIPYGKVVIMALLLSGLGLAANAQINTKHFFSAVTKEDILTAHTNMTLKASPLTMSWFLRGKVAETAWEVPLFHGGGGQMFSATGVGLSLAAYDLSAVEKFSIDAILYAPNTDPNVNGVSTALTIGIPIPKLNLPNINVGIREDWKAKVTYLQTSITLEF